MFFGGISGGVAFYPDRLVTTPYVPPVALTEFHLSGIPVEVGGRSPLSQTISHTTRLKLSHEQNTFSLGFLALSYRNPANNRYRYKLEPLENTWHEVGSDERLATYTTLPAKLYIFRLQAATSRGEWSEPGVELEMEILPPLWRTAWFEGLCGVLVLASVRGLPRLRLYSFAGFHAHWKAAWTNARARPGTARHIVTEFSGVDVPFSSCKRSASAGRSEDSSRKSSRSGRRAIAEGRDAIQNLRSSTPRRTNSPKL